MERIEPSRGEITPHSGETVQHGFGVHEVRLVEASAEPVVNGREQLLRLVALAARRQQCGQAELTQIFLRQLGDLAELDLVLGEGLRVLAETELIEPLLESADFDSSEVRDQ
jgi:hypothetical protein